MMPARPSGSSSPFKGNIASAPATRQSSKVKPQQALEQNDSGHDEVDEDPSPRAQPPVESEPLSMSSVEDSANADQGTSMGNPPENEYMSDADLYEEKFRRSKGYQNFTDNDRKVWQTDRAKTLYEAGHAKHFECSIHLLGNSPCTTFQEYYPSREVARPVVSAFFGHNKDEWTQIPKEARVFLCRKCYQRLGHKFKQHLATVHLPLCREMVNRLEKWRPGCRFKIQLTKSVQKKIQEVKKEPVSDETVQQAPETKEEAINADGKPAKVTRSEKTDASFAMRLDRRFGGDEKSADDVRALLDWLEVELTAGTIKDLPAFEALLELNENDKKRIETEKSRRALIEQEVLGATAKATRKKRQPQPNTSLASTEAHLPEAFPTAGPSNAAAEVQPAPRSFTAINASSSSNLETGLPTTSHVSASDIDLLIASAIPPAPDASGVEADIEDNADPFYSSFPAVAASGVTNLPKIKLRLNKGKAPIRDVSPSYLETPTNRKRACASTCRGGHGDKNKAPPAKKAKHASSLVETGIQEGLGVERAGDLSSTINGNIASISISEASRDVDQPSKLHLKSGDRHMATLTVDGMKVIIDFDLTS